MESRGLGPVVEPRADLAAGDQCLRLIDPAAPEEIGQIVRQHIGLSLVEDLTKDLAKIHGVSSAS